MYDDLESLAAQNEGLKQQMVSMGDLNLKKWLWAKRNEMLLNERDLATRMLADVDFSSSDARNVNNAQVQSEQQVPDFPQVLERSKLVEREERGEKAERK